jgi:hypothetical protein
LNIILNTFGAEEAAFGFKERAAEAPISYLGFEAIA